MDKIEYASTKPGVFNDPVVRCNECQKLLRREELAKIGNCKLCGSKSVKEVLTFNSREQKLMRKWGVDEDFLALFEPLGEKVSLRRRFTKWLHGIMGLGGAQ